MNLEKNQNWNRGSIYSC